MDKNNLQVFFFESFQEEEQALKRYLPRNIQAVFISQTIQSSRFKQCPSGLLSIRTQSIVPPLWIPKLKGLLARSSGYDHLREIRRKIPCGYLPNYCARAVAEQAVLLAMALLRRIPLQVKKFESFNRDGITGLEAKGKNLLVIGVGHIGSEVVRLGRGLEMNVRGVDIVKRHKGISLVSLAAGLKWADVTICCLPLTKKTEAMLNYKTLKAARLFRPLPSRSASGRLERKGLLLINIARGEISPLTDMQKLLEEGILSGLGLDVYENESILAEDLRQGRHTVATRQIRNLMNRHNVLFTPHNAFNTSEALERKAAESVAATQKFLTTGNFPNLVPVEY